MGNSIKTCNVVRQCIYESNGKTRGEGGWRPGRVVRGESQEGWHVVQDCRGDPEEGVAAVL